MRLICPSCGAIHSAESWLSDADARQCLRLVCDLPWEVSRRVFNYLALFRPQNGRGLIWSKVLRLLTELNDLVVLPTVKWDRGSARPNSARVWALAIEKIIEMPPKKLPLKSHGYLNAIAYEIADEMDKTREKKQSVARHFSGNPGDSSEPERISADDMKKITDRHLKTRIRP